MAMICLALLVLVWGREILLTSHCCDMLVDLDHPQQDNLWQVYPENSDNNNFTLCALLSYRTSLYSSEYKEAFIRVAKRLKRKTLMCLTGRNTNEVRSVLATTSCCWLMVEVLMWTDCNNLGVVVVLLLLWWSCNLVDWMVILGCEVSYVLCV